VVTLRVKLVLPEIEMRNEKGEMRSGERREAKTRKGSEVHAGVREVWFGGKSIRATVYERERLVAGDRFGGPAVVVQMDSTTVVPPGWRTEVHRAGNLVLERA